MTRMWEQEVAPEILRRNPGSVLVTRTLKTTGIGEGTVDEMMSPLLKSTNPSIGIYARADDEVDYCFQLAKALGARAISCEISVPDTKRIGQFANV